MSEEILASTILVVDDVQDNRDLIRRRLERIGYRVEEAEQGHDAIERIGQGGVDLVILDIMMPGLTGIDVLRILRRDYSASELPIIMATAKDQSEDVVEALDHGANDYVTKPLDFPVVLARVQAHLRTRTPKQEVDEEDQPLTWDDVHPGAVLQKRYRLEDILGSGNFGTVYRATHMQLDEQVAVKVLQTAVDNSPKALERFRQEGTSAFRLQHPNAVAVYDFHANEKGLAFLVMELLRGRNLEDELKIMGAMEPERCAAIILPIVEVLAEAHGLGIIHRDIKPANIFLHRSRRGEVIKVLDFGIAKLMGDSALGAHQTLDEGILGTPAYMAPERLKNELYDGRADVYSLAVLLYQLLTGVQPFRSERNEAIAVAMMHLTQEAPPLSQHRPGLPTSWEDVMRRLLCKDPRERPTAPQMAELIKGVLGNTIAPAKPSSSEYTAPVESAGDPFDLSDLLHPPASAPIASELPVFAAPSLADEWS